MTNSSVNSNRIDSPLPSETTQTESDLKPITYTNKIRRTKHSLIVPEGFAKVETGEINGHALDQPDIGPRLNGDEHSKELLSQTFGDHATGGERLVDH